MSTSRKIAAKPAAKPSISPPISPMLAKVADALPTADGFLYEPKWDGFRAIVFRQGGELLIQSRELKSLNRYFPELVKALDDLLPKGCVIDGEIVVMGPRGLDFDVLQARIHPAETRITWMAKKHPAAFVAFDILAAGGKSVMDRSQADRRVRLEQLIGSTKPPVYLTPVTRDHAVAADWLKRFEGAGLDGVIAKPEAGAYLPGKRAIFKIKHARTADCVVAGFRWYKGMEGAIGSLLLGLYDESGVLQHAGIASSFSAEMRQQLVQELAPLGQNALKDHPWRDEASKSGEVADGEPDDTNPPQRIPGAQSRWSSGKDLSWEPLRPERACEVKYDHLQGDRFRHPTTFLRWRDDKPASECRYDQLEVTPAFELNNVFRPGKKTAAA